MARDHARGRAHGNFTVDDVLASAKINGHEPTRDNVRSQLHNYKKRKFAVAAGFGKYALTDLGKVQIGFGKDKKNAAPPAAEGEAANGSGALTPDFGGSHPPTQT